LHQQTYFQARWSCEAFGGLRNEELNLVEIKNQNSLDSGYFDLVKQILE
jgi:hypothetical protein